MASDEEENDNQDQPADDDTHDRAHGDVMVVSAMVAVVIIPSGEDDGAVALLDAGVGDIGLCAAPVGFGGVVCAGVAGAPVDVEGGLVVGVVDVVVAVAAAGELLDCWHVECLA